MPILRYPPLLPVISRRLSTTAAPPLTIGIRREDPSRIWERRCPLTPDAVHDLVHRDNVKVLIQECERRVFPMSDFVQAGAHPHITLDTAHIILGIKEPPLVSLPTSPLPAARPSDTLVPRTHLMFSHTAKGQPYNMSLLSRFLEGNEMADPRGLLPRLIDYELLVGEDFKRTVGFGWFAGVAGVLESLSALAHSHLELGVASPFLSTPRPHTHTSLSTLRTSLRSIGDVIIKDGTPKSLGPFVIGLTGAGNVAQGALSLLSELPIVKVDPQDLPALVSDPDTSLHQIYLVHALPASYLTHTSGQSYSRKDYYDNPNSYRSEFHAKIAPYLTLFLNGAGWSPSFPRIMSNDQLTLALEKAQEVGQSRFRCIGDISCDVEGGLQFMPRASTLSSPFYTTRPPNLPSHLPSVQIMAVDILPTSIPLDASSHFSTAVLPYLKTLVREYRGESTMADDTLRKSLDQATVTRNGKLVGKHGWLMESVNKWRASSADALPSPVFPKDYRVKPKRKVLMLGSGMVASPAIDEICRRDDVELVVASNSPKEADQLTQHHSNAKARFIDMGDKDTVGALISGADIVISLLPVPFHPFVAELCIKHRKHLVTASYISSAMKALNKRASDADVLLLNEIGLDPGIDHCSAMPLLSSLRSQNKRILSFTSFCGGLPAPEHADVPLGYKFSWSPRGVLNAALNGARFRLHGENWSIPGDEVMKSYFPDVPISNILKLEGVANRDSIPYAEAYELGPVGELRTLLRGTLRYPGFSRLMQSFKAIGLLRADSNISMNNWPSLVDKSLEKQLRATVKPDLASIVSAISDLVPSSELALLLEALDYLSLLPSSPALPSSLPPLPITPQLPIALFATLLAHKLRYEPHERDLVILSHEIVTESPTSPASTEVHTSSLITYGTPRSSAMSRCVGLPVAFATLRVLDGGVSTRGVAGPTENSICCAVLKGLEQVGLGMKDSVRTDRGIEEVLRKGLLATSSGGL